MKIAAWVSIGMGFLLTGCFMGARAPALDLKAPGWQVRQAQAVWKPDAKKPEIAGDVVVSTNPSGDAFVQFSKTLPIASARLSPNYWEADFPPAHRHYSGHGKGPSRIVWLQLLRVLEDKPPARRWTVMKTPEDVITLSDAKTGERLEVHF